jgi:hypothetical protein
MAKKTSLNELGQMLTHVVKHMETLATKEDVAKLGTQVTGIERQLRETKTEIP